MRILPLMSSALILIVSSGCGTVIFKSTFDGSGSPQGPPPGNPADDQIVVNSPANPVLAPGKLVFHPTGHSAWFFSHPVQDADATKTIFWTGQLTSGEGPFSFMISARDAPGSFIPTDPLELTFSDNEIKVIGPPPGNEVLHSHALNPNGAHEVFVSLRLKSETFRITIQQPGAAEIELTGQMDPSTANWIKNHSRIMLQATFGPDAGTDTYEMGEVLMREK